MARPENIIELRESLLDAYEWVKSDPRRAEQVKEMTNAAGKVINSLKIEIEYSVLRNQIPNIEFMGGEKSLKELQYEKFKKQLPEKPGETTDQ